MKNRYLFFKRLYPDYVIIFDNNKSFGYDKLLLEYIKNKDINYIMVDNDNNIKIYEVNKNKYKKYIIKIFLKYLIETSILY